MGAVVKRIFKILVIILIVLAFVVGGYIAYMMGTYYRIADHDRIDIVNDQSSMMQVGKEYTAVTYNIGFGAYTPDYTFFLDEGMTKDGEPTVGTHSTAVSRESVEACTNGAIDTLKALNPDFLLLQEVDTDSTRSYNVNQKAAFEEAFPTLSSAFAVNFHSSYLAYPIGDPHGIVNAGLLLMGNTRVSSATRYSYPIDEDFPTKFFDLDRCFAVERLPVSNGKELVLINNHMSAYTKDGTLRERQLALLCGIMEREAASGNYVIVGGDWNHALGDSLELYESNYQPPTWVSEFNESLLPQGFSVVRASNIEEVPTCRNNDEPYEKGHTYTVTVDGFVVSSNVKATAQNIDAGFKYSDHNPVLLTFALD